MFFFLGIIKAVPSRERPEELPRASVQTGLRLALLPTPSILSWMRLSCIARASCSALVVKHCLGCQLESTKTKKVTARRVVFWPPDNHWIALRFLRTKLIF